MTDQPDNHTTQTATGSYIAQAAPGGTATVTINNITRGMDKLATRYDGHVRNFLEYYLGAPGRPAPFGGRSADVARLNAWLHDPNAAFYALLVAPAGRGKSALLAHWVARLSSATAASSRVHVVYFPISIRYNTNLETVTFASLAARMAALHDEPVTQTADAQQYRGVFVDYLRRPLPDGGQVLVVLDGLDEAAGWEAGADLFPAVPPEHLRVVVAARPLAGDADERAWLARLGWETPGRATCWSLERLTRAGVADVLVQMGNPLDVLATKVDVVSQLYKLSEGDPLLVRLYVEALLPYGEQAAVLTPEDLLTLKPGLKAYLDRWFEEQHKLWGDKEPLKDKAVRGLLNLCATALGPLKKADVLALAPDYLEDSWLVGEAARAVNRFVIGDGVDSGYVFSHPRLGEYFAGELEPPERQAWQARFLKHGKDTLTALEAKTLLPKDASPYAVQYYGAHLDKGRAPNVQVYALVCKEWLDAWQAVDGTPAGFLTDVNRAWARAEAEGPSALGHQVLDALCWASVTSLSAKISNDILLQCIKAGVVTPRLGLVTARQKPDLQERAECLASLAEYLPSAESEKVMGEALAAARAIGDEYSRAQALSAVAERLPETERALLAEALAAARAIGYDASRAEALSAVAERLPETERGALLAEVLAAARAIGNEKSRAEALSAVAERLPETERGEVLAEALAAARAIGDEGSRAKVLSAVAARLPETERAEVLGDALAAARAIRNEWSRAEALRAVAAWLPETEQALLGEALAVARAIGNKELRAAVLGAVAARLPERSAEQAEVLGDALAAARAIGYDASRAEALSAVAERLPERSAERAAVLGEALAAARTIEDERYRAEALSAVAQRLPERSAERAEVLGEALAAARAIGDEGSRAEVLSAVAARLPETERAEVLGDALAAADAIGSEYSRARALSAVAAWLPETERAEVLGNALAAARAIGVASLRFEALGAVAARLPETERAEVLGNALAAARTIGHEGFRASALSAVVARLPETERELLGEALAVARAIGSESLRVEALSAVAQRLPETERALLGEALAAARAIGYDASRAEALSAVAQRLPETERGLLGEALAAARAIGDDASRAGALSAVAQRLPETERAEVLGDALAAARAIGYDASRAEALGAVAARLPETERALLGEALAAARAIGDERSRARALSAVAARLPERSAERAAVLGEALAAARAMGGDMLRARALSEMAEQLTDSLLAAALEATFSICDQSESATVLSFLAPRWSEMCQGDPQAEFSRLSATLRVFAKAERSRMLEAIAALLPVLERLGGQQAVRETAQAIVKAARWWP